MAEEVKTEAKKEDGKKMMFTILKVIIGLALLAVGAWLGFRWFDSLKIMIKGGLVMFAFLAGVITLAIAKE